ncbi:Hemolysin activation/secretion protein [Geitlerinema sp. FC II]|nr:Hemolysin activation/secretion protein [Geitlerinema sp. FC II]
MHRFLTVLGSSFTLLVTFSNSATAQLPNPNTPPLPTPLPSEIPEEVEPPLDTEIPPPPAVPEETEERLQLEIRGFDFQGSTVFDEEDWRLLNEALQGTLIGVPIGFERLIKIEAIVGELYRAGCNFSIDASSRDDMVEVERYPTRNLETVLRELNPDGCYLNSGAVLVAGDGFDVEAAIVPVRIVEGRVEDEDLIIDIEGLNESYIRGRLQSALNPLDRNALLEALQLLQLDPHIDRISAQLSEGGRADLAVLNVGVLVADSFDLRLFSDNGRAPTVGTFRRGIQLSDNNLLGIGDRINLAYTNTDGSHAGDISYRLPLNPRNGTLEIAGGLTDTNVIEEPFDLVDIEGNSRYFELRFRQPLLLTPTTEFALGLTASRQESESELLGERFPLSAGANEDGETRISALRFFQDFTHRGGESVFAFRSQLSLGLGALDATVNNDRPDSEFFAWRGQAQYVRRLSRDTLLFLRSDLQFANDALMPLEQFGIGGFRSVRGYRQDSLLVDNGVFTSAEIRIPVLRVSEVDGLLQVVPFVDFGWGWNSGDSENPDPNTLVGLGLGLQWQMVDRFLLRLDWGIPLTDVESSDRTLQEDGLYFSVEYNPF